MILSPVLNSRQPEIIMIASAAQRQIQTSSRRTTVKEVTIATVKNAGKSRSHQWLHQAI
jgi:hypothetical protein